jgi:exonuclease III
MVEEYNYNDNSKDLTSLFNENTLILESSNYVDIDDLSKIEGKKFNLKILHLNIHSTSAKRDSFCNLLNNLKLVNCEIYIAVVCETFMNKNNIHESTIPGYRIEYKYREEKTQGGVAIYINNKIKYIPREDISVFQEGLFESCFIEIVTNNKHKNIVLGEIYRVPKTAEKTFLENYKTLINKIKSENKEIIIGSDQNIDYLKVNTNNNASLLLDLNLDNELIPIITRRTRVTHSTAT